MSQRGSVEARPRRKRIVADLVCAVLAMSSPLIQAQVETRSITYQLDFPAEELGVALQKVALLSKHKLFYTSELVEGKRSSPVKGTYTAEDAIRQMLSGTGLTAEITSSSVILIRSAGTVNTSMIGAQALTPVRMAQAETAAAAAADSSASSERALDEIVVTGSRIVRDGYSAPTPVTVLVADELFQKAPNSIADGLNQLPTFLNSTSPTATSGVQANATRGNFLNLRGLGPSRTLVMLDGRRVAPSSNSGATDIDLIPQMLIERVDVVTGGASAAYGSDAVSGVVNFILDDNFTGLKTLAQGGISSRDDDESYRVGVAGGTSLFNDRLHVMGSAERVHREGIPRRSDRPRSDQLWVRGGTGVASSPYIDVPNVNYTNLTLGGYVQTGPLAGQQFLPDGSLGPFNPGTSINSAGRAANGDGVGHSPFCCSLVPPVTSNQFFGRATFDITSNVSAFAEAAYSQSEIRDTGILFARQAGQMIIYRDNAYLTDAQRAALGSTTEFQVNRSFDEWGPNPTLGTSHALNAAIGLKGTLGGGWNWNVSYVRGDAKYRAVTQTEEYRRFYAAVDAVRDVNGNIVCRITITNPGLMDDCMPLNTFGENSASLAHRDWIRGRSIWSTQNEMDLVAFGVTGDVAELWAGPLSIAAGGEYRELTLDQNTNSDPNVPWDRTGVRSPNVARFYQPNVGAVEGSYDVKEAYLEANLPLLKDAPFAQALELNGAIRRTDYSTSGLVTTWKTGLTYEPIDGLRFRGALSRDIRAPSLNELFAGQTQTAASLIDPLTGFSGAVLQRTGGNPDLKPEIGETWTVGFSVGESLVPGFSAGLDYFNIELEDAIASPFTAQQVLDLCFQSGGTNLVCNQITRDGSATDPNPGNFPRSVLLTNQNVSSWELSGIDFEMAYRHPLANGELSLRVLGSRLMHFQQQDGPGRPVREFAGTAADYLVPLPKWRGNVEIGYDIGQLSLRVQERIIGKHQKSQMAVYADNDVPTVTYTDLNVSYGIAFGGSDSQLFLTVNNVFDEEGPLFAGTVPGLAIPVNRSIYDIIGRYFTVGLRSSF